MKSFEVKITKAGLRLAKIDGKNVKKNFSTGVWEEVTEKPLVTAFETSRGWYEFQAENPDEAIVMRIKEHSEFIKEQRERMNSKEDAKRKALEESMNTLLETGTIECTEENVSTVINYLNTQNWGTWSLPSMEIGYKAAQYDCDGKQVTTMTFDRSPFDKGYYEGVKMFKSGIKRGHLEKYKLI